MGSINTAKRNVTFRLPPVVIDGVVARSGERDISQADFVEEALREKFDRIERGEDQGWGPLAGLREDDRARVLRFIECLRTAPKARGFRRAVDANFAWLMETVLHK